MIKLGWLLVLLYLNFCLLNQFAIAEERLKIVAPGIAPISYEIDGKITGVGTELVREAFARLGLPIELQIFPGARALIMLQEGEADALFALAKTPERESFAEYPTTPIIDQPISLFVRKDSMILFDGDVRKLSPYAIGIIRGGRFSLEFEKGINDHLFPKIEEATTYSQNILKLESQRLDIIVGSRISVLFAAKELGKQDMIKELSPALTASSPAYLAFSKKGKAIKYRTQIDEMLKAMYQDGTYDRIIQSYLK